MSHKVYCIPILQAYHVLSSVELSIILLPYKHFQKPPSTSHEVPRARRLPKEANKVRTIRHYWVTKVANLCVVGAASVLWLPIQAITFLVRSGNQQLAESPLCETGLLLLLALMHHAPVEGQQNPYLKALQNLKVPHPLSHKPSEWSPKRHPTTPPPSAKGQYNRIRKPPL